MRRRFTILPSSARNVPRGRRTMSTTYKLEMQAKILGDMQVLMDKAVSPATSKRIAASLKKWYTFAEIFDIDLDTFGDSSSWKEEDMCELINCEGEILAAFAAYIFRNPVVAGKNTIQLRVVVANIAHVKTHIMNKFGRVPGQHRDGRMALQYTRILFGIKQLQEPPAKPRLPILQQHLLLVKQALDLDNNKMHRALWALWLTQWQGAMRCADLVRAPDINRPWSPALDTHRNRISAKMIYSSTGKQLGVGLALKVKPLKADQRNERIVVKEFLIDQSEGALSAGAAIFDMIKGDETVGNPDFVPLFRDPETGREITYAQAASDFNAALKAVGLHELARGLHSLRIGGTSALLNAEGGGEHLATTYGGWTSDAVRRYMYVGAGQLAEVTARMARQPRSNLRGEEGPISRRQQG